MQSKVRPKLCASRSVSDRHKLLLLKAPGIFTYLTLGLFLDPEQPGGQNGLHPVPVEVQSVWQRNVTETLQQLALFPSGREALLAEPSVLEALRAVAECGSVLCIEVAVALGLSF